MVTSYTHLIGRAEQKREIADMLVSIQTGVDVHTAVHDGLVTQQMRVIHGHVVNGRGLLES